MKFTIAAGLLFVGAALDPETDISKIPSLNLRSLQPGLTVQGVQDQLQVLQQDDGPMVTQQPTETSGDEKEPNANQFAVVFGPLLTKIKELDFGMAQNLEQLVNVPTNDPAAKFPILNAIWILSMDVPMIKEIANILPPAMPDQSQFETAMKQLDAAMKKLRNIKLPEWSAQEEEAMDPLDPAIVNVNKLAENIVRFNEEIAKAMLELAEGKANDPRTKFQTLVGMWSSLPQTAAIIKDAFASMGQEQFLTKMADPSQFGEAMAELDAATTKLAEFTSSINSDGAQMAAMPEKAEEVAKTDVTGTEMPPPPDSVSPPTDPKLYQQVMVAMGGHLDWMGKKDQSMAEKLAEMAKQRVNPQSQEILEIEETLKVMAEMGEYLTEMARMIREAPEEDVTPDVETKLKLETAINNMQNYYSNAKLIADAFIPENSAYLPPNTDNV